MIKRKSIIILAIAGTFLALGVPSLNNAINITLASDQKAFENIKEVQSLFLEKRENVDFNSYIEVLKVFLANASVSQSEEDLHMTVDLLTTAIINSIDEKEAKDLLSKLEGIISKTSKADVKVRLYSNVIRLYRMLGDTSSADKTLKAAESLKNELVNKSVLGLAYLAEAQGDIVDLKMQSSTVKNLNNALELFKGNASDFSEKIILTYIYQSQVELYYNKDASKAMTILEHAGLLAEKCKNYYFYLTVEELKASTYPFFFKYKEGIEALKPVVKEYLKKGYNVEAYRAQDKLVTQAFDSGDYETALSEGAKLKEMREKIVNKTRKEYFEEYNNSLYQANVYAVENKLAEGINLLESAQIRKFEHVYSVDMSVYHMYLGNLNFYSGNYEKALDHYLKMTTAIEENSNGDSAYVYTDTSLALAQAYNALERYEEGYEVLNRHLNAYVTHDMEVNKRDTEKLTEQYEAEKKDKELLALKLEAEKRSKETIVLLIVGAGLIVITFLIIVDRNKVKKYNAILAKLSTTDGLTGLSNRRALDEFLGKQSNLMLHINKANEDDKRVYISALMMDIDFFKQYNDNYGHAKGDKVLQLVGEILKPFSEGDSDIIARYGGEEFALILANTDKNEALRIAAKIKKSIIDAAIPHQHSKVSDIVTLSIGVATKNIASDSIDTLIEDADKALYYSKNNGRNTFTHFSEINN